MKIKKIHVFATAIPLLGLVLFFGAWHWATLDSRQYSPGYVFWKIGLLPYADERVLPGLVHDYSTTRKFVGKTLPEVQNRFGNQFVEEARRIDGRIIYKIPGTFWGCTFKNGKCTDLGLHKG